jgi:hypothetical protein
MQLFPMNNISKQCSAEKKNDHVHGIRHSTVTAAKIVGKYVMF